MTARNLSTEWIHLGLGASAIPQEPFDGFAWYERYGERVATDGNEARLISSYKFTESWDMWEMHPNGDEVVLCTKGTFTLIQEDPETGAHSPTTLEPGQYIINPAGTWHTADVNAEAEALFITAGIGTQHRPRQAD